MSTPDVRAGLPPLPPLKLEPIGPDDLREKPKIDDKARPTGIQQSSTPPSIHFIAGAVAIGIIGLATCATLLSILEEKTKADPQAVKKIDDEMRALRERNKKLLEELAEKEKLLQEFERRAEKFNPKKLRRLPAPPAAPMDGAIEKMFKDIEVKMENAK
jgi:hypothetical protein